MEEMKPKHQRALTVWLELGPGRSYRKAAKKLNLSFQTVAAWGKKFKWRKYAEEYDRGRTSIVPGVVLTPDTTPVLKGVSAKLWDLVNACDMTIKSCFDYDEEGNLKPRFEVRNASEFARLLGAEVEVIQVLKTLEGLGTEKKKKEGKFERIAESLADAVKNMTKEETVALLRGTEEEAVGGRIGGIEGRIEEADYTEVPGGGVEDGGGRDGVPDGDEPAEGGDEAGV